MDWWLIILIFLGALIALMFLRIPVFLSFIIICIVGSYLLFNGEKGLYLLITSLTGLTTIYGIVVLPMFVMMGEVLFQSGVALKGLNTIDQVFGKLPGRLAVVAVIAGVVFGAMSGSSIGNAAMLGTTLTSDMENRKYSKSLRLGSVMGAGALAAIIPPSGMAVLIASIGEVSVGKLLISGILPGS